MIGVSQLAVSSAARKREGLVCSLAAATVALLCSCKQMPPAPAPEHVTPFSAGRPGGPYPGGWYALGFSKYRKETQYALVDDCGTTIVEAHANSSSSGLVEKVDIDPRKYQWLVWRWKVPEHFPVIDNTKREGDDAPVRIDISFDGDFKNLPLEDRLWKAQVKVFTGMDLPYATLEYTWGNGAPAETVIINTWTARIRMLMVESGAERAGQWVTEKRNVYEDYRRAFGEEPGRITTVGIITDTDATKQKTEGYYGDIAFFASDPANAQGVEPPPVPSAGNHPEGTKCPVAEK